MARSKPKTLDDLIDARGLPLGDLASAAGLDDKTLLNLRTRTPATVRVATVAKLAKALGVDPATVRAAIEAQRSGSG